MDNRSLDFARDDETIVNNFKKRIFMKKKLLLMMLCLPMLLAAQQTNGVKVSGLAVDAGTVTFHVHWTNDHAPGFLWSDTVWVFVDYNQNGVMERLPLLPGATLTTTSPGGEVIEEPDNNQGVWVAGNARTNSSFSATVQLLTATANLAGVCAYASNYPPVGKYISASEISFTGTPEYKVVLERINKSIYTVTVDKGKSLLIPNGEAALSFTDKTGAPGKFTCIPMTGSIGFTVPAIVSKGLAASFEAVTSNLTAPDAAVFTYTWSAPEFSPDTHSGATYTPTAPAIPGTYPVALTVQSERYCDLAASKDVKVIDCIPSTVYDLEVSASGFCEGSAGVTFALSGTDDGNSYQLYRDGTAVGSPLEGDESAATFSGFFEAGTYSARTIPGGSFCPAVMNGTHIITVATLPTVPTITASASTVCQNTNVVFSASGTSGATYTWSGTSGTASGIDNASYTVSGAATGTKSVTAYANLTSNGTTCQSDDGSSNALVSSIPAITTQPASTTTICAGYPVQLSVVADNASGYQWRKNGANVTDGSGATSATYTTGAVSSNATYTVMVDNTGCSVTSTDALITALAESVTAPNSIVNFTAFVPCSTAPTGTVWYLTDTRETSNNQTYKVKKMADGHIWMVQDLKFGDKCSTSSTTAPSYDVTGQVTSLQDTYYGTCINSAYNEELANYGYYYSWPAAINQSGAWYGSTITVGCSGTLSGTSNPRPGYCRGVCPQGWHVPTGGLDGEFAALHSAQVGCTTANDSCWNISSAWEGNYGGDGVYPSSIGAQGVYQSSTMNTANTMGWGAQMLTFGPKRVTFTAGGASSRSYCRLVRCLRNY
jgi:uncharacterized protein (TIGR02145 family)